MTILDDATEIDAKCPYCGYQFTHTSGFGKDYGEKVTPGSVTLCLDCGEFGVFGEGLSIRKATQDELEEIMETREAQTLKTVWHKMARMN